MECTTVKAIVNEPTDEIVGERQLDKDYAPIWSAVSERGAVSTEVAILVAVLVGIAVFVGAAMVDRAQRAVDDIDSSAPGAIEHV